MKYTKMRTCLILTGLCLMISGCGTRTYEEMPDEVVGVWKTPAPKYADRYFELRKNSIVVGQGGTSTSTYPVTKIKVRNERGQLLYKIEYVGSETETQEWVFTYDAATGVLRLKSQSLLEWRKAR